MVADTRTGTGKIKVLRATCEGKKHDKNWLANKVGVFRKGITRWQDLGFQGYEPEGVVAYQPKKKPNGKKLRAEEKECDRQIASERVDVEHSIRGDNVFAIVREV